MPPSADFDRVQHICANSSLWDVQPPFMAHFHAGLQCLQAHGAEYDVLLDKNNPFYREFAAYAHRDRLCCDDCFCLFECIVIFIRMRQMACANHRLTPSEHQVLQFFETCGEWDARDDKLVSRCYWSCIPSGKVCMQIPATGHAARNPQGAALPAHRRRFRRSPSTLL